MWRRKWQPTLVFLPGESQGWRSLVGCRLWGRPESDTTEATQQQQQAVCWQRLCLSFSLEAGARQQQHTALGGMAWLLRPAWGLFLLRLATELGSALPHRPAQRPTPPRSSQPVTSVTHLASSLSPPKTQLSINVFGKDLLNKLTLASTRGFPGG